MSAASPPAPAEIAARFSWSELLAGGLRASFTGTILPGYLAGQRWFGAKGRVWRGCEVIENLELPGTSARVLFLRVAYAEGAAETYALPLQTAAGAEARGIAAEAPRAAVAWFRSGAEAVLLYDAIYDAGFREALLRVIVRSDRVGALCGVAGRAAVEVAESRVLEVEQSNSSILYGTRFFLKLYRRIEEGVNPDAEITRFLSERQHFAQVPEFAGALEYAPDAGPRSVLALLVAQVPNGGDAWSGTLGRLREFCAGVLAEPDRPLPAVVSEPVLAHPRLLGRRTAEMHLALAGDSADPAFAPEPCTAADWQELRAALEASIRTGLETLRRRLADLPEVARREAAELVGREGEILARHGRLGAEPPRMARIRIHGDYHLGQVLESMGDFIILDFEGEPARPLAERRRKNSPLRDVAGMLRSFGYATRTAQNLAPAEDRARLAPWLRAWERSVSRTFLESYLTTAKGAVFLPEDDGQCAALLEAFLLDKAIYEVGYELNNRPDWLPIPVGAILALLGPRPA